MPGSMIRLFFAFLVFFQSQALAQESLADWRSEGARSLLKAAFETGDLAANQAALEILLNNIGQTQTVTLSSGEVTTAIAHESDRKLLETVTGSIDLTQIYKDDKSVFIQLAMLSDVTWNRLRTFVASQLWHERNGVYRDHLEFGLMLDERVILLPELESNAFKLMLFEASEMVAGQNGGTPNIETYSWIKPDCTTTDLCEPR